MSRLVELDRERGELVISFPYEPALVQEIKSLRRRRWDPTAKVWRVPQDDIVEVRDKLSPLGFQFDDEPSPSPAASPASLAGSAGLGTAAGRSTLPFASPSPEPLPEDTLSLSGLTERVQIALKEAFPVPLWVVGEIVDLKPGRGRHMFFSLVEQHEGEDKPRAKADAVLWMRDAAALLPVLRDQGLELRDGIRIRARVRVDFWSQAGRFRVVIEAIDPAFTLGQMALDREKLVAELRAAELHRRQKELPLPRPIVRIGVLTSLAADGWNDFHRQLEESGYGFELTVWSSKVQGPDLKRTMLSGLRWFARRAEAFDVVCILRGGGSRTDLRWFDDRELAFAVARHPLKVLVAIGHERDHSVLDEIAHREKTPTALAVFVITRMREERELLTDAARRLREGTRDRLAACNGQLRDDAHSLGRLLAGRLARERSHLTAVGQSLRRGVHSLLQQHRSTWSHQRQRLRSGTALHLEKQRGALREGATALRRGSARLLERATDRLQHQATRCRLLDPRRVLERGFALLRNDRGSVITDAHSVTEGETIEAQLRDGRVRAAVRDIRIDPPAPPPIPGDSSDPTR